MLYVFALFVVFVPFDLFDCLIMFTRFAFSDLCCFVLRFDFWIQMPGAFELSIECKVTDLQSLIWSLLPALLNRDNYDFAPNVRPSSHMQTRIQRR